MEYLYDAWEYHPVYGCMTRLVYRVVSVDRRVCVCREYKKREI